MFMGESPIRAYGRRAFRKLIGPNGGYLPAMDERVFRDLIEPHRRELRAYCYRMAGSLQDGDDLLQESLLRAWKNIDRFEGRAALRTWLYRVAHSACIDALEKRLP